MKKSKLVLISLLALIFVASMLTTVNAASGSISVASSASQVVKGKTFTVTIAGTADQNITALQAALSFDSSKLSLESKTAGTGFTDSSGSDSEIAILSTDSNSLSKSGTLYTLTFKVLDTAEVGETTVKISDAKLALVNDGTQENVSVADASATVTIKADDTTIDNKDNNNTNSTSDDNSSNSSNKSNSSSSNSSSSNSSSNTSSAEEKTTKLPQTGVETVSIVAIAGLTVFAVISYVSYKKYKNI